MLGVIETLTSSFRALLPGMPPMATRGVSQVPKLFREPYVHSGYRHVDQPWRYYCLSFFQMHNESLNVWTHAVALLVFLSKWWTTAQSVDFWGDPHSWPLAVVYASCCAYVFCSLAAHLLQSKSELVHYTSFLFDYMGISLYAFGSGQAHYYYSCRSSFLTAFSPAYPVLNWLLAFATCLCLGYSKIKYDRPYPLARKLWQIISVGTSYLLIISPVLHRLLLPQDDDPALRHHALQILCWCLAGSFFASPFPQKLIPGLFDLVGHGHQLFHVLIAMCTFHQMHAVYLDALHRRTVTQDHLEVTLGGTVGVALLLVAADLLAVLLLREKARAKLDSAPGGGKQQ